MDLLLKFDTDNSHKQPEKFLKIKNVAFFLTNYTSCFESKLFPLNEKHHEMTKSNYEKFKVRKTKTGRYFNSAVISMRAKNVE